MKYCTKLTEMCLTSEIINTENGVMFNINHIKNIHIKFEALIKSLSKTLQNKNLDSQIETYLLVNEKSASLVSFISNKDFITDLSCFNDDETSQTTCIETIISDRMQAINNINQKREELKNQGKKLKVIEHDCNTSYSDNEFETIDDETIRVSGYLLNAIEKSDELAKINLTSEVCLNIGNDNLIQLNRIEKQHKSKSTDKNETIEIIGKIAWVDAFKFTFAVKEQNSRTYKVSVFESTLLKTLTNLEADQKTVTILAYAIYSHDITTAKENEFEFIKILAITDE
jgi:hypothetical protein